MMSESDKQSVVFPFVEYLRRLILDGRVSDDDAESIQVAIECLGASFAINLDDPSQRERYSLGIHSLERVLQEGKSALAPPPTAPGIPSPPPSQYNPYDLGDSRTKAQKADALKAEGNALMIEKRYDDAIKRYTDAILLSDDNAIYFANRAAARMYLGRFREAVDDCRAAIRKNPKYSKAYHRLGNALFQMNRFSEAIKEGYSRACELEPENEDYRISLERAQSELSKQDEEKERKTRSQGASPSGGLGGLSGLSGLDLGSLLSNPSVMSMASSMMQQPEMASMVTQLAGQMFGGGGSGGDGDGNPLAAGLSGLMSGILGGAGGATGSGTSRPARKETTSTTAPTDTKDDAKEKETMDSQEEKKDQEEDTPDLESLMQQLPQDFLTRVMNPVEFQKILENEEITSLENDPKFGPIIQELRTQGPFALMGYLNDPDVIRLLGRLAKKVFGDEPGDGKSEESPSYFS
eukprot:TRINITY_DN81017_c0_g1_i1.p1 TRINITY_DN81017_c0_g1~~TRINITY_DN81017_c0_g1_i1.p1  ORF type:complete len:465 (-),score=148.71 TRINITY_DN81017_c0_g1_i1:141-1535(-)